VKIGLETSASGRLEIPSVQNKMMGLIWFVQVQRRLLRRDRIIVDGALSTRCTPRSMGIDTVKMDIMVVSLILEVILNIIEWRETIHVPTYIWDKGFVVVVVVINKVRCFSQNVLVSVSTDLKPGTNSVSMRFGRY